MYIYIYIYIYMCIYIHIYTCIISMKWSPQLDWNLYFTFAIYNSNLSYFSPLSALLRHLFLVVYIYFLVYSALYPFSWCMWSGSMVTPLVVIYWINIVIIIYIYLYILVDRQGFYVLNWRLVKPHRIGRTYIYICIYTSIYTYIWIHTNMYIYTYI
jgi:hypothetical protein